MLKASVAIVILAAGKASRMGEGGKHKLLAEFDGIPLVRRSALTALGADAASVTVVVGHRRIEIEAALQGLALTFVDNPDYASGMASSLMAGFSAAHSTDGILVMLADMPGISTAHLNALIFAFRNAGGEAIVRAVSRGKPGNPVILPRSLHHAVRRLEGDVGARDIIATSALPVLDVDVGDAACLDVDTPDDIVAAGGAMKN
ncbi:nucleotidyltransferase family protein [Rhizobium beringeri]|jgi:molybdenum cofactor cytidylyltransferase|uniref:Molybdopterin-guanine dinucleotide biosynthesis protein MobA n=1 Tax=Rhizobium leguminosarum TaxID=384 RepID=A0A444IBA2_RHILE|nr:MULTISPECIES: NTP transferase domain-containing protein [Rhizobium]MBY5457067.1 NTP transferase domain-containing protein [Rhizobium leguminosarum]RWX07599.1 molybdopterin-guanine dinucleotide biosynthesis protein MobA [Rhizobium leguminosarum]RWX36325.1 molybdopterin-guanine dinucleotide biosynthesis protein MobA [Rhizobium leguminosarum]TAU38242.1 molybdopterin-guanine dinucleotide biosynthesis protein MobA [Rhizobium leguminosarum]TBC89387.1 molybdopterin-guanine dinucleotide biosynthesi